MDKKTYDEAMLILEKIHAKIVEAIAIVEESKV